MTSFQKILFHADRGVARVTLNRPAKRNALDAGTIAEIRQALDACRGPEVRAVVLTGAGQDFCSGADLAALQAAFDSGVLDNMAGARTMAALFLEMRHHPKPIVAAVRGRALAGGCGLATACDLILAEESALFGYPEVNIGFIPAMVMAILRRSLPEKRALEIILSGDILSARAAHDLGLVNRVFPDSEFDAAVDAYVSKLASKSASALTLSKQLLYHMDSLSFEAALEAGVQANAIARMTEDCRHGIEHFLKKS